MIPIVRILVASKKDDRSQAKTESPAHVDWTLKTLIAAADIFWLPQFIIGDIFREENDDH